MARRCSEIFQVLEQSKVSDRNPGLTQSETEMAREVFHLLCGKKTNTHLSSRELACACSQSYFRANRLVRRMKRSGKQVGPVEFVVFFQKLPPSSRQRLRTLLHPHQAPSVDGWVCQPELIQLKPEELVLPPVPSPSERSHKQPQHASNQTGCCVVV